MLGGRSLVARKPAALHSALTGSVFLRRGMQSISKGFMVPAGSTLPEVVRNHANFGAQDTKPLLPPQGFAGGQPITGYDGGEIERVDDFGSLNDAAQGAARSAARPRIRTARDVTDVHGPGSSQGIVFLCSTVFPSLRPPFIAFYTARDITNVHSSWRSTGIFFPAPGYFYCAS